MAKVNQTFFLTLLSDLEQEEFKSAYSEIVKSMVTFNENVLSNMSIETDWMVTVLDYNVFHLEAGSTVDRIGCLVPATYKQIVKNPTKENMRLAYILGWVVEILKSANRMSNSIMDGNVHLLGNISSWHIREDVGMTAINDSLMLRIMSHNIINVFFSHDDKLNNKFQDLMREVHESTVCGRVVLEQIRKSSGWESYTMENYNALVKYQTAYLSYYFPIVSSVILAGQDQSMDMSAVKRIILKIGGLSQLEQDFKEIFENKEIKRFSWFYIRALEKLRGKGDFYLEALTGHVLDWEVVRNVYQKLELPVEFQKEHSQLKKRIIEEIENLESDLKNYDICDFMRALL